MAKKEIMKEITKEEQIDEIIRGIMRLCPDYNIIWDPYTISIKATFWKSEVNLEELKKEEV